MIISLKKSLKKLFKQYKRSSRPSFLDWLLEKRYILLQDYLKYKDIYDIYTCRNPWEVHVDMCLPIRDNVGNV